MKSPAIEDERGVKDIPILMHARSIAGILEGRKTQTRRIMKPRNAEWGSVGKQYWEHADFNKAWADGGAFSGKDEQYLHVPCHINERYDASHSGKACDWCKMTGMRTTVHRLWSSVKPGDLLWVRETFLPRNNGERAFYKADMDPVEAAGVAGMYSETRRWKPGMFMPRKLSRLTLPVEAVYAQRVQDISETDCVAEGILGSVPSQERRGVFSGLWDDTNGKGAWERNAWVWVYRFSVRPGPAWVSA